MRHSGGEDPVLFCSGAGPGEMRIQALIFKHLTKFAYSCGGVVVWWFDSHGSLGSCGPWKRRIQMEANPIQVHPGITNVPNRA